MAGSDAVVDVSNVCWSSALPPLGKRSPVWGRLELVIDAWRQLHGPDVQFHLLADESLVHILDDPSGLGELQASGTLITSPVADTKILQLARDHDLHVITRDHFIDYRSAYPWIEQHPDRFHSWETEGGVVNIVPLGISPRSLQEISMAFEVRDLKRTRLDPKNPVHKRILYTRWRCANANCPQSVSWQGQLNAWPMVSATGVARCPTCDQPLVELGPRPHLWEVVVQERESQQELLRFPLEADVPEIIGRGATATAKGIDLSVMEAPFRDSVERVSRLHLLMRIDEVSSTNWRLAVIDLQSTNGTQVERWSGSGGYLPAREVGPDKETYLSVRDRLVLGGAVQLRVSGKRYIMDSAPPNVARSSTAAKSPATINPATIGKSRPLRLAASDPEYLGQYRVLRRLGTGGMGTVYLGEPRVGRRVAIKVLHPEMVANEEARARFAQEVAAARRVSSPNVISIVDADTSAVIPWLAMEYVKGPSLSQAVQENLPLPAPALPVLAVGLARALAAAHDSGIVHRDVKPSNLLL